MKWCDAGHARIKHGEAECPLCRAMDDAAELRAEIAALNIELQRAMDCLLADDRRALDDGDWRTETGGNADE
jgi:hypothetical protein